MKIYYKRGDKFNNLTFIKEVDKIKKGSKFRRHAIFKCECGKETIKIINPVVNGKIKSCGSCKLSYVTPSNFGNKNGSYSHGMYGTRFYNIFYSITNRCNNLNNKLYGQRGIKNEWKSFKNFKEDMYKTYTEHIKKYGIVNTSIDRIDVNGNYCKKNCRWATKIEQSNNRRNNKFIKIGNIIHTEAEWIRILNTTKFKFNKCIVKDYNNKGGKQCNQTG